MCIIWAILLCCVVFVSEKATCNKSMEVNQIGLDVYVKTLSLNWLGAIILCLEVHLVLGVLS